MLQLSNCMHPSKEHDTDTFKPLDKIYKDHEKEKKDMYEERVLQSEKGSFVSLVFTTSGGMGPLCTVFVDRIVFYLKFYI